MNAVTPFLFEQEHMVRALEQAGEPWFVATDVCRVLGISNNRNAFARLDEDEKGVHTMDTPGGEQQVSIISESGLYALTFTSRKEAAKRFRKWVTSEVLPSIRKTGGYGEQRPETNIKRQQHALALIDRLKRETDPAIRKGVYAMLDQTFRGIGIEPPPLDEIGREVPPPPDILFAFWQAVRDLEAKGIRLNHAHDPSLVALRLPEVREEFRKSQVQVPVSKALRDALKQSRAPRFVGLKAVHSALTKKTSKCWVFDGWNSFDDATGGE